MLTGYCTLVKGDSAKARREVLHDDPRSLTRDAIRLDLNASKTPGRYVPERNPYRHRGAMIESRRRSNKEEEEGPRPSWLSIVGRACRRRMSRSRSGPGIRWGTTPC